jgi:hypothetical protein
MDHYVLVYVDMGLVWFENTLSKNPVPAMSFLAFDVPRAAVVGGRN